MALMFDTTGNYERNGEGLWIPPQYKSKGERGDVGGMFEMIEQFTKSADASPKEKAELDRQLSKKIGTLFRLYYNMWNSSVTWGAAEKPVSTPTTMLLREASRQSLVDRLLINARCFQIRHVCQRVTTQSRQKGWNVRHKFHMDPNFEPDKDVDRRCREMEELLLHPNPEIHGRVAPLRDALVKMVRGELIVDRKAMIMVKDSYGRPASWHLLPPDEIKPRLQVLLKHMKVTKLPTIDAAVEDIFNKYGVDVGNAAYIQEIDNQITGAWSKEECSIDMVNPSDELDRWGWGVSPLEESLEATTLLMLGLYYNKQNFLSNYPEAFLFIQGDVDQEGLEAFKKQIYAQVGTQGNQRLPVFATGDPTYKTELHRLRDSLTDMQFVQLIRLAIALKCAAYRAHPSEINFSPDMGDRGGIIPSDNQEKQIALAQEEGFHSILDDVGMWLTANLIEPYYDDLMLVWSIEDAPSEVERIDIWTKRLAMGNTVDEWRKADGRPPLKEVSGGKAEGWMPNSPFPLEYMQGAAEQQASEQQAQMEQQRQSGEGFSGMEAGAPPKELAGR